MPLLSIESRGPLVAASNFWDLPEAALGKILVSINAGAVPRAPPAVRRAGMADMATAKECVVSRGPWPAQGSPTPSRSSSTTERPTRSRSTSRCRRSTGSPPTRTPAGNGC